MHTKEQWFQYYGFVIFIFKALIVFAYSMGKYHLVKGGEK